MLGAIWGEGGQNSHPNEFGDTGLKESSAPSLSGALGRGSLQRRSATQWCGESEWKWLDSASGEETPSHQP